MNILFVCTGNTCRSPMAQGMFSAMLQDKSNEYDIRSAGVSTHPDDIITDMARNELLKRGIDYAERSAVQISSDLIEKADLVLSMTSSQRRILVESFPCSADKIHMLGDYTDSGDDVLDPYGGNEKMYELCANHIHSMLVLLKQMV